MAPSVTSSKMPSSSKKNQSLVQDIYFSFFLFKNFLYYTKKDTHELSKDMRTQSCRVEKFLILLKLEKDLVLVNEITKESLL